MEHFEALQALLNETDYVGLAGGDHAVYHAVAETQIGKSLHIAVPPNEYKVPELYAHLQEAATQEAWGPICSVNPLGMDDFDWFIFNILERAGISHPRRADAAGC